MRIAAARPQKCECGNVVPDATVEGEVCLAINLPCPNPACTPEERIVESEGSTEYLFQRFEVTNRAEHRFWSWARMMMRPKAANEPRA